MAQKGEPSYTDLVYAVLQSARRPLTFQEIFDEVNRRRPITTRDPKATIRSALTQGRQLVNTGDGRYGYLPQLLSGSLLRVPLTEKNPADHPLIFPDEVRHALWPSFFEPGKRKVVRPAQVRLPNGDELALPLDFFGAGNWGSAPPEALRRYLGESRAKAGDSLLIRVLDGESGRCEAWLEPHRTQNKVALAKRNQAMADAAYQLIRKNPSREMPIWDLVVALLARGLYRSDVAPDTLEEILKADPRFVYAGIQTWMLAEAVTPEMQALIRRRLQMEPELYQIGEEAEPDLEEAISPLAFRRATEKTMADLGEILSERQFGSTDEVNAFLKEILATGDLPHREAETALDKAQDLMYDAWEAPTSRERVRMARRALEISPDCADAYVVLAEETARSPQEEAELYAKGVAAGERALGKKTFEEDAGHFWGFLETRPYMRARSGLAQALWELGQWQEAIEHIWDMLRLNPNDNQGLRYLLLSWLLEIGDDAQVEKLLKRYPGDIAAMWLYGRALHAFRTEGNSKRARKMRAEATQQNPYVPAYLLGQKRMPRTLPETMGIGDESEAITCADEQLSAWRKTPGALTWLAERT